LAWIATALRLLSQSASAVSKVKQSQESQKGHFGSWQQLYIFPFRRSSLPTQRRFMKNLRSILLAVTVLLLATAPQAQTTNVKAAIPFDFVVDDHAYPAGEYTVKSPSQGSAAIRIDNADESEKGVILSNACSKARPAVGTTLVFQRLGDNYFLHQVWTEGNSVGRQFRVSKKEVQLAKNFSKPELVIVAANISH
jgi:hypothetical protein